MSFSREEYKRSRFMYSKKKKKKKRRGKEKEMNICLISRNQRIVYNSFRKRDPIFHDDHHQPHVQWPVSGLVQYGFTLTSKSVFHWCPKHSLKENTRSFMCMDIMGSKSTLLKTIQGSTFCIHLYSLEDVQQCFRLCQNQRNI